MRLANLRANDIVLVSKGGRRFHAHVKEVREGVVAFAPIERGITYRHASAREVLEIWHRRRPRGASSDDEPEAAPAVSKAQLSLAGRLDSPARAEG